MMDMLRFAAFFVCLVPMATAAKSIAKVAVLLPADERHMFSIKRVAPGLEVAKDSVNKTGILTSTELTIQYGDSKCSNAEGMNQAVTFYADRNVDVFFGPCCDYAAAPVARQVAYWNTPLLTAGAMAKDFGTKAKKEFSVLTRVGANFNSLGDYLIKVFHYFDWSRIMLLYNPNGRENVMHRFCHIATDGVHFALRTSKNFTHTFHKFHKIEEIIDNLPEKLGRDYGEFEEAKKGSQNWSVIVNDFLCKGSFKDLPEVDDLNT